MAKDFDPFTPPEQSPYQQPEPPQSYANPCQPGQSYPPPGQSPYSQPPYQHSSYQQSYQPPYQQPLYQEPPKQNHSAGVIGAIVTVIVILCCCCAALVFIGAPPAMFSYIDTDRPLPETSVGHEPVETGQARKIVDLKLQDSIAPSVLHSILTPTPEQEKDAVDSNFIGIDEKTLIAVEVPEELSYIMSVSDDPGSNVDIEYKSKPDNTEHLNLVTYQGQSYLVEQTVDANGSLNFSIFEYPDDYPETDSALKAVVFKQDFAEVGDDYDPLFSEFEFFDSEEGCLYAYISREIYSSGDAYSSTSYTITRPIIVSFDFTRKQVSTYDLFERNYAFEIKPIAIYNGFLYYLELSNTGYGPGTGTLCKQYLSTHGILNEITEFSAYSTFRDSFSVKSGQGFLIAVGRQDYDQDIYVFDMSSDQAFLVVDTEAGKYQTPDIAIVPGGFLYTDVRSEYNEPPIDLTPDNPDDDWLQDGRNSIFLFEFETGEITLVTDSPANWSLHFYGATDKFIYCWMAWRDENLYRVDWTTPDRSIDVLKLALETTV